MIVFNKKIGVFATLLLLTTSVSIFCNLEQVTETVLVKQYFDKNLLELQEIVSKSFLSAVNHGDEKKIKEEFLLTRQKYKEVEFYVEYFFPTTAVLLNGAPIDEIELGENLIENPTGFQVMEELIFNGPVAKNKEELLNEIKKMKLNLARISRFNEQYQITDAQILDALRLEIFRITSLGITGFDAPLALNSLPESASALRGVHAVLDCYGDQTTNVLVNQAINFVQSAESYDNFDRLQFTTEFLQPINEGIASLRNKRQILTAASGSALREDATSMFGKNAFDVNRFVSNSASFISKEKSTLGEALFSDVILSNNGGRSCQSCHHQALAFTDGLPKPAGISKLKMLDRNTPTLMYAGLQRGFFYDLKAGSLEDQALDVVHHKEEMGGSLEQATIRINKTKKYSKLFKDAFPDSTGTANPWKIQHALASYIRSLSPFTSKLDRYMGGDKSQLTSVEKSGYNLFMGKAKCGSCHFAPIFNGTQAPLFLKSEAEVLGVPSAPDTIAAVIDSDPGRFGLYQYPQYRYAFKTPTVRNISRTAPYMHNGVYRTLEQVLDFYNRGGGAGIGIHLDNQTLSGDPLKLSRNEIKSVIAFLNALEDKP
ncbi:MAG: cytochrome c peroxidase [Pedobacter sp.]